MIAKVNRKEILDRTDKVLSDIDEVVETIPCRYDWSRIDAMNELGFGWNIKVGKKGEASAS